MFVQYYPFPGEPLLKEHASDNKLVTSDNKKNAKRDLEDKRSTANPRWPTDLEEPFKILHEAAYFRLV